MKKTVIILVIPIIVITVMFVRSRIETKRIYDELTKPQYEKDLTIEECDELEQTIVSFLEEYNAFYDDYMFVDVSTGFVSLETGLRERKTTITVLLDGELADNYDDALTLMEGYQAALTLYFGEKEINEYDIDFRICGKYNFLNGVLVETEG